MKFNFWNFVFNIVLFVLISLLIIWSFNLKMSCFIGHELISEVPAWCWMLK